MTQVQIPPDSLFGRFFEDARASARRQAESDDWFDYELYDYLVDQDEQLEDAILREAEVLEAFADAARL